MRLRSFPKKTFIVSVVLLCIGCLTDLILLFIFGRQIPGYNQLTFSISSLGVSTSPVFELVTMWSVILGVIFIFFGFAFRAVFREYTQKARIAAWLIIIYGIGEDIVSGVFRADHINGELTASGVFHNVLGGIGVIAILILPWVMRKIFIQKFFPFFFHFSALVWLIGIISMLLFSLRNGYFENTFVSIYKGLWQRIFLIDIYIYFAVIAFMMMKKLDKETNPPNNV
jgi:hypothetical protein